MPAPRPVLGYASMSEAADALRAQGLTWAQVQKRLGLASPQKASALAASYRHRRNAGRGFRVQMADALRDALRRPATARGMTPAQLAERLVRVACDDGLIDAILEPESPR